MTINSSSLKQVLQNATLPDPPADTSYQATCVFLLLFDKKEPHVLAVLKSDNEGYPWRNQVALPGGHVDKGDGGPVEAAFRELKEEMSIPKDQVEFVGSIGHFQTINNRDIEVFVGLWNGKGPIVYDAEEIEKVLEIPLKKLMRIHSDARLHGRLSKDIKEIRYPFKDVVIWGVTARILHFFIELFYPLFTAQEAQRFKGAGTEIR